MENKDLPKMRNPPPPPPRTDEGKDWQRYADGLKLQHEAENKANEQDSLVYVLAFGFAALCIGMLFAFLYFLK